MHISFNHIQKDCQNRLLKGVTDTSHPYHNMVVATCGYGEISACTVVLRALNELTNVLFFTDARSEKVRNI